MTNKMAIALALVLIAVVALDLGYFGWDLHIFLGRKLGAAIHWMAFWR